MARKLIVRRTTGLGDTAFAVSAASALKAEDPETLLWFDGLPQRLEWVSRCPVFEKGYPPATAERIDLDGIPSNSTENRALLMAEALGVKDYRGCRIVLDIDPLAEYADYVCLAPYCGGEAPARSLSGAETKHLVEGLGVPVIMLPGRTAFLIKPGQPPQEIPSSEFDAVRLALSCQVTIGVDSGIPHVTALLGKPTLIIFTHVAAAARAKFYPQTTKVLEPSGLACWPCGDFAGRAPCYRTPGFAACAKQMTAARILDAFRA